MFSRYRIKEVKGKFIPQRWCFTWEGIDRTSRYLWYLDENQEYYCEWHTLEQARQRIQEYRGDKRNIKYHKA